MLFSIFIDTVWHRQKLCRAPKYFKLCKSKTQIFCLLTLDGRQKWEKISLFSEIEYWKINLQLQWTFTESSQNNENEDCCTQTQNIMLMIAWILSAAFHLAAVFGTNTANNQVEHFYIIFLLLLYLRYFPSIFCSCQRRTKNSWSLRKA